MSARNMRLTSRRAETPKVKAKLREADDTPRSLRIHQRSERPTVSICKLRTSTDIQFVDNVLEKRKNCVGVDPGLPWAKRSKVRPDATLQGAPVPCTEKSPINVSANGRQNSEQSDSRVLRPRKRQTACCAPASFHKVRLSEDDYFSVINKRIKVFWDIDNEWYSGWIKRYDPTNRLHHVVYEDRDEEWVSLERDIFELELLPAEPFTSENAPHNKHGGADDDPQQDGIPDSQMTAIEASLQKRPNRRRERLQRSRAAGHIDDSANRGIVDASGDRITLGSAVRGFGAPAFSSVSDDACSVSQSTTDRNPDICVGEPPKRRTIVKTYYRKRRRKLTNSVSVGDSGNGIRLPNSEKTPDSCHPSLGRCLWLFSRGLANVIGSDSGFIPTVEMEICIVEKSSGLRKFGFWGTFWEFLIQVSGVLSAILHSEGTGCPVLASIAPGLHVLPAAVQSITVRLWSPCSPPVQSLECPEKWTTAMRVDLNGFLREIGILQNFTSPVSSPVVLDGSVYTFRPGIGFVNDLELKDAGDPYFISGPSFQNLTPQYRSEDFLCIASRRRDSIVIAKKHRNLPSFSLVFGAAPDSFVALHLNLLLGNMTGLSCLGSDVARSSYMLNGSDVNNSKAGIVECDKTIFPAFRLSGVPTYEPRLRRNELESSGRPRAFGEDLTARFNVCGYPFVEHSKIQATVSPRNTPDDIKTESSPRFSNYGIGVARTSADSAISQDVPVLPVLKFRTIDNGKWRLVGISKSSSMAVEALRVVGSGTDYDSLLRRERGVPAVHHGFREGGKFCAGADGSGPVEFSTSGCPSSTLEIAGDGSSKSKILRRRRGRPSRKDKEDGIKEMPMDSSNMGTDLASLSCSANILLIGEDRCWRESDAIVQLESSALNEWQLAVKLRGLTKFTHKPREQKSGTSKRGAHSIIWRGGRDWRLEFLDKEQWNLFKEMHSECYNRNGRAASIRCIPIPGVRLIEDNDCSSAVHFVRPSLMYIQMAECETTRALSSSRVLYDMDSDDEEWLSQFNSTVATDGGCRLVKVAEETFEKIIDKLEKASFRQQSECLAVGEVAKVCSGLGPMEVLMAVHAYWLEKRKKAGMALVRQLRVSPSDQIEPRRKKLLQKQRSIKLSIGGRHLVRNQGIGMGAEGFKLGAESRVREARATARFAAELAATKRAEARRQMQIADLAAYRAVAISKNAEAIQAIETSCSSGQFPNENSVTEEGSVRPFVEDLLNFLGLTPSMEVENKIQLQQC